MQQPLVHEGRLFRRCSPGAVSTTLDDCGVCWWGEGGVSYPFTLSAPTLRLTNAVIAAQLSNRKQVHDTSMEFLLLNLYMYIYIFFIYLFFILHVSVSPAVSLTFFFLKKLQIFLSVKPKDCL